MRLIADVKAGLLRVDDQAVPCSIGRGGPIAASAKREGDGATPLGVWPVRGVLLRPDRTIVPVDMMLPWRWLRPDDGWSDEPADPAYNRPVRHPHGFGAERLWREDELYDVIVLLAHNDAPPMPGIGSAIFLHCWRDGASTEGCVAVAKPALLRMLSMMTPGDALEIV